MNIVFDETVQVVPIKSWAGDLDPGTLEQAAHLAALPFAHHHVALMPDAHHGYGMPIGGVFASRGQVIPNAVGVDIGCGMHARRTNIEAGLLTTRSGDATSLLRSLIDTIHSVVPSGNGPIGSHPTPRIWEAVEAMPEVASLIDAAPPPLRAAWERSSLQLGTLGGGNHFIEVQADEAGMVWLMLHSGSRALGKEVCDHFNAVARDLGEAGGTAPPRTWQLNSLPTESDAGRDYLQWMQLCMAYALENRRRMLDAAIEALFSTVRGVAPDRDYLITEAIDTHHNYADHEHHFGEQVWVHRKGAVRARAGEMVIIPGSMETGSYIARGLGNAESFETCSHGAGRRLSRTAAKKVRTSDHVLDSMRTLGIEIAKRGMADVAEEAGHAYKDVDEVMRQSADLVEPVYRLRPLGVIKG